MPLHDIFKLNDLEERGENGNPRVSRNMSACVHVSACEMVRSGGHKTYVDQ